MLDAMNHYEQECRRVCPDGCGKDIPHILSADGFLKGERWHGGRYPFKCLAPTEAEFAERMAQEAKDARDNLAALVQGYPTFAEVQAERDNLAQEVERLTGEVDFKRKLISKLIKERDEESTENTLLREALEEISRKAVGPFYEYGSLARAALAATGEPECSTP